jgi:hypothetical protein
LWVRYAFSRSSASPALSIKPAPPFGSAAARGQAPGVDDDPHGAFDLVFNFFNFDIERLARRSIIGELPRRAAAHRVVDELGGVRAQLFVDRGAEKCGDLVGLARHPIQADLGRGGQRAALVILGQLGAHAQDHDVVDHARCPRSSPGSGPSG